MPPQVKATITKSVAGGAAGVSFTINVDCRLGLGTTNIAVPTSVTIAAGASASIMAPVGASCTVSEPNLPAGYELVSIAPATFTMPEPTKDVPQPNVAVSVVNRLLPATLKVIKVVSGGTAVPADFSLSVKQNNAHVTGSPAPGLVAPGRSYTLTPGTYVVGETGPTGYTGVISGDCNVDGAVTLAAGESKTCTITNTLDVGSLKILKTVSNPDGATLPATFAIHYVCTNGGPTGDVNVAPGGSQTVANIPAGASCTVTEATPGAIAGYTWGTPVITGSPAAVTKGATVEVTRCELHHTRQGRPADSEDAVEPRQCHGPCFVHGQLQLRHRLHRSGVGGARFAGVSFGHPDG